MEKIISLLMMILSIFVCASAWPTDSLQAAKFFTGQNQLLRTPFSLNNVWATSMEMAAESCRESFKWRRWNCPRADFFRRQSSQKDDDDHQLDREDAYVNAINTAAILYTLTKNCSSGTVAGCGCVCSSSGHCSDNPSDSERLYNEQRQHNNRFSDSFTDSIKTHNYKAIAELMRNSLVEECSPIAAAEDRPNCWRVLRPFNEIADDIRSMYDRSLQLSNEGANSQVIWKNIPLDALVYVTDSPNFCEPEAVPGWGGMRGRHCMRHSIGDAATKEERRSCLHLCRTCGFRVKTQNTMSQQNCNCRYSWGGFMVQCDTCVVIEQKHTCY